MKPLILIGAGGHGRVVADAASMCGYREIKFLDRNWPKAELNGAWPVIGFPDQKTLREFDKLKYDIFVSIGQNLSRQKIYKQMTDREVPKLLHPKSMVSNFATVAQGTIVAAGVVVNAFVSVGTGVILNTSCTVDHDCTIGDFVHVSPGANLAGGVAVGARSWIGIGAVVKEGITIGKDVMIGAGAVVVEDVKDETRVLGNPARSK